MWERNKIKLLKREKEVAIDEWITNLINLLKLSVKVYEIN